MATSQHPADILEACEPPVSAARSRNMSAIRGKDTAPEIVVRRALHRMGFRFRLHSTSLPGRPDIVLTRHRAAIFVHGCFWHRHDGCRFASTPSTRRKFWADKFERNVHRDWRNIQDLRRMGWRVLVVWECALRKRTPDDPIVAQLLRTWMSSASKQDQITTT
jgi:DNA mismatch endonuclease (patch repair protein)